MLLRALFAAYVLLALLGDARIFLFVMNRFVFGSHRQEKSPWQWLMWAVPPVLLLLTIFVWRYWLPIAALVGLYWILTRLRANYAPPPPLVGIRYLTPARTKRRWPGNEVYYLEVTHHEIVVDDLPESFDGYRIAFLTDTHVAPFLRRAYYRDVVARVQQFDPDLVLFGGDFVTWRRHIPLVADRLLDGLTTRDGIFAVLGNHDYWAGLRELPGVRFLINDRVFLRRGDGVLPLAGIDEMYRGKPDVARAFDGIDDGAACLAISHHPDVIDLVRRRIDLLLCGHTHGGQIRFPFFGAVVVPSRHEAEYAAGFHRVGPVLMYVSRGIGAIPPLRFLCRPEVATFTLRRGRRKE